MVFSYDVPGLGNIDLQLLVQHRAGFSKVEVGPELIGRQRTHDGAHYLVLQHVSGPQRWNADVLLVIVGVNRSIGRSQVLYGGFLRHNDASVGLAHPDIDNVELVAERAIANLKLPQRLHPALAVYL